MARDWRRLELLICVSVVGWAGSMGVGLASQPDARVMQRQEESVEVTAEAGIIQNPVLRGFNPDPAICRAGDDYYIATSTFQWWPGVQIHHSKDLVHWRLLTHGVNRVSQLDLRGDPDSGGVWSPDLTYTPATTLADGTERPARFWLVYTDVKSYTGAYKDTHNYVISAPEITGPWSEPVYMGSSGYDPSLFHDEDGKTYYLAMLQDFRPGRNPFAGITLQEFDTRAGRLVGPVHRIFSGTPLGLTEAPNLYKRDGWYYLVTAEGGTFYGHAVTVARAKVVTGPYEIDPKNPMLTSRGKPELPLQKAGHGSMVRVGEGAWYMAHLAARPVPGTTRCVLGRETCIQKIEWDINGWPRLAGGGNAPAENVPGPRLAAHPWGNEAGGLGRDEFDRRTLSVHYQSLRVPMEESWMSLRKRPGRLTLVGRESLESRFAQSMIARRVQSMDMHAGTAVRFDPENFQQAAGLIAYYDTRKWYYLHVTRDEERGRVLRLSAMDKGDYSEIMEPMSLEGWEQVEMRVTMRGGKSLRFAVSRDGLEWSDAGSDIDATTLSDDYGLSWDNFTGMFVGLCAQDLSGLRREAEFEYFEYVED